MPLFVLDAPRTTVQCRQTFQIDTDVPFSALDNLLHNGLPWPGQMIFVRLGGLTVSHTTWCWWLRMWGPVTETHGHACRPTETHCTSYRRRRSENPPQQTVASISCFYLHVTTSNARRLKSEKAWNETEIRNGAKISAFKKEAIDKMHSRNKLNYSWCVLYSFRWVWLICGT